MRELTALLKKQPRAEPFVFGCRLPFTGVRASLMRALSKQPSTKRCDIHVYILCYVFGTLNINLQCVLTLI